MAQNVTWPDGTQYTNVPFINLPKTGGGHARFTDVSLTNAVEADVTQGKTFFKAYGSAQTGSWSNHIQNIHLTGVQIDAGEKVAVGVRSRGSNYYGYVGTLTIKQTS